MDCAPGAEGAELPGTTAVPESNAETPQRRSSRRRLPTTLFQEEAAPERKPPPKTREPRRNPKRKASDGLGQGSALPGELLSEALKPLTEQEIGQWEGWIELESEPAFFSTMLRELGVQDVKAHELFGIDQDSLDILPKPVHGLIFLYEVIPDLDEAADEEEDGDLWFANQTINNACATVALLNIVMNAQNVELGDKLREFKDQTKDMCTALRGHYLGSNTYIRTIHNSFTRRMDHLNADLFLESEATKAAAKKKKRPASKKGSRKRKAQDEDSEYGFHFVAYVPADGYVWELDGLKYNPRKLGPIDSEDWTTVAQPQIQARMLQYADTQLAFNLLALCQSPLASYSRDIAQAMASLEYLRTQMQSQPGFLARTPSITTLNIDNAQQLSEFRLTKSDIENTAVPQSLKDRIASADFEVTDARDLHEDLVRDVKVSIGEYRSELMGIAADELKVHGRKKDYGPALHRWVEALAKKGVLEDIITNAS